MNTIKIKETEYPCRVTMGAIRRFKVKSGKDVSDSLTLDEQMLFYYCCVCSACNADDVPFGYDEQKFFDSLSVDDFSTLAISAEPSDSSKKKNKTR